MKLDRVHDIQQVYRKVVNAMSYPGEIQNVSDYVDKNELVINFYNTTLALIYMLLDAEVTFKVFSKNEELNTNFIAQLTHAKATTVDKAGFIFVLNDATKGDLLASISNSYEGDLIDPHTTATIIIETSMITKEEQLKLTGPGIKDINFVNINLSNQVIEARNKKNKEFPLGIDVIVVDSEGQLVALPRTTQIS